MLLSTVARAQSLRLPFARCPTLCTAPAVAGDSVEVLPSDRFSVDGVILSGRTAADESSLTGEPAPVPKGPGDWVRAGTSNVGDGGAVRVRTTAMGAQSVLGSVIALVEDAQVSHAGDDRGYSAFLANSCYFDGSPQLRNSSAISLEHRLRFHTSGTSPIPTWWIPIFRGRSA